MPAPKYSMYQRFEQDVYDRHGYSNSPVPLECGNLRLNSRDFEAHRAIKLVWFK